MKSISILLFSFLPASLLLQIFSDQVRLQLSTVNYQLTILLHEQDTLYFNSENKLTTKKKNAQYFKVVSKIDSGYVVELLDKGQVLTQKTTYKDPDMKVAHGNSLSYFGKTVASQGIYVNGKEEGIWKYWRSDGSLSGIVNYKNGKRISEEYFKPNGEKEIDPKKIEQLPSFPGGPQAMAAFYSRILRYPPAARERGVTGTVKIGFNISTNGELQDIRVISGPDEELNNEALRLIKTMPRWIPAIQFNRAVKFAYVLPVSFQLG
jgi:TonB family protein